jgi:hypothetical protein
MSAFGGEADIPYARLKLAAVLVVSVFAKIEIAL